jgi:flagellar M-ring protein FliF
VAELIPLSAEARSANPVATRLAPLRAAFMQPAVQRALPAIGTVSALLLTALAWYAFQAPAQSAVFQGLADADKAAVADALQTAGITHAIDRDTGAVTVASDQVQKARILLASQGLPKAAPTGDSLIGALPMGASRALEGETLRGAREADLARTIEGIDAVKSARVHLATPAPSPFLRDEAKPAASVMLALQTGRTLSEAQVRAIGHLVASSVPGLGADQVAIVDQSGQLLSQRSGADERSIALQAQIEDRSRRALAALLSPMVGAENYTAEIHADLDESETQSTRESYPKDDRALRREEGTKSSGGTVTPPAIGVPGTLSNQPPAASSLATTPPPAAAPGATPVAATATEENYARAFDVGREISVTHQPVGRVKRLSIAVALREVKGAKPRSAADLAAIERLVKSAVGFDAARGDTVALLSRPFAETTVETVAFYDKPWFMAALRQGGALLGALLVFLLVGRPLLKAFKARAARARDQETLTQDLLEATGRPGRSAVTLDMIDAAPSYEARANLVRDFVRQDAGRAATVVKQLMADRGDG